MADVEELRLLDEIMTRLREIHERYTPASICERLNLPRDPAVLEPAVRMEAMQMLAEYQQVEKEYRMPGLAEVALHHLEGLVPAPSGVVRGSTVDGQHRRGAK